jgi:HTH-type transcriptional regulator/antitoxin HigA
MILKLIRNEQEYDMALREVDRLIELNPALGSKESDNLEVLLLLIEKYEEENWDISEPDPSA